jgi:hypothetical protein
MTLNYFWLVWSIVAVGAAAMFIRVTMQPPRLSLPVAPDSRKYCRDCRWCVPPANLFWHTRRNLALARCGHITSVREPAEVLVRGTLDEDNMQFCASVRQAPYEINRLTREILLPPANGDVLGSCGPEARYWEAR